MDAYDIFKQLTVGARFSRKRPVPQIKQQLPQSISDAEDKPPLEESEDEDGIIDDKNEIGFQILSDSCKIEEKSKKKKIVDPETKRRLLEQEKLNHFRKVNRINVNGKNVPPPIKTFEELESYSVPIQLIENLALCGYPLPTPVQMQAIPIMLKSRPLMACAPTGSGKTVAFLTPIIKDLKGPQRKGFRALILCPTRELARQIYRECLRLTENIGLRAHIISKVKQVEQKFGVKSNKKFDILVTTPNRIRYLLTQQPPVLDLSNVEWVIIDEADKLMEEGQNSFKEQLDDILTYCTHSQRKMALFSATYTVPVAKWAKRTLKGLISVTIGERNSATDLVHQELLFVGSESGKLLAFRDLVRNGLQPPVLVFVQSKDRAKQLFDELIYDAINVDVIHADRTQQQRDNVVKAFREGKIWVLICTELMSRGIDFKGVNLVVNYDFPPSIISYIHRIGRTGRAGRPGKAITYFTQDDTVNLRSIAHVIKNSGGKVPQYMLTMKKHKKAEKKKMEKKAPEREDITTLPEFMLKEKKLKNSASFVSQRKDTKLKKIENGKKSDLIKVESKKQRVLNGKIKKSKMKIPLKLNKNK